VIEKRNQRQRLGSMPRMSWVTVDEIKRVSRERGQNSKKVIEDTSLIRGGWGKGPRRKRRSTE